MESQQLVLGIQKETVNVWERRVPLTPEDVQKLVKEHNIKVVVQPSSNRAFNDWSYEQAGALISDDLSEAQVILGIKPVKPNQLLPNKTYIKYSRIHTGSEQIVPYLKLLLQNKVCLIDYEKVKDEKDNMLIGSSKLAGVVGIYDIFRLLGEFCLIRMNLNTPFLFSGGSAYMHQNLASCEKELNKMGQIIKEQGGLPKQISPFIFGIVGGGIVSAGALELLERNLMVKKIDPSELKALNENPPADANQKIYVTVIRRQHFLKKKDGAQFDTQEYENDPLGFESVLAKEFLPNLSVLVNCAAWQKGTPRLITVEQIKEYARNDTKGKLIAINDHSVLSNGPVEFFRHECTVDRPYFLYDPTNDKEYRTYNDLAQDIGASSRTFVYHAVDQLPAELPQDASQMFSSKLSTYLVDILKASAKSQKGEGPFQEIWKDIPLEIRKAVTTTSEGKTGEFYDYLNKLL